MRAIGYIRDGKLISLEGELISEVVPSRAIAVPEPPRNVAPLDPIDEFNMHLAQAIRLAQSMSAEDKSRASEVMEAARGALTMVTRLSSTEQRRFEAAMRAAARGD